MATQIIKQPNGKFAVFCSITDCFVGIDYTPNDLVMMLDTWMKNATFGEFVYRHKHLVVEDLVYVFLSNKLLVIIDLAGDSAILHHMDDLFPPRHVEMSNLFYTRPLTNCNHPGIDATCVK